MARGEVKQWAAERDGIWLWGAAHIWFCQVCYMYTIGPEGSTNLEAYACFFWFRFLSLLTNLTVLGPIRTQTFSRLQGFIISYLLFWPAFIWKTILDKKNSACYLLTAKCLIKKINIVIWWENLWATLWLASSIFPLQKIRQMKAGQN